MMKIYNNEPRIMRIAGVRLMPGPDGNDISPEVWAKLKKRPEFKRRAKRGSLTGDGYRPMSEKRPRSRPGGNELTADGAGSRRARESLLTGGAPDHDLVAELEGKTRKASAENAELRRRIAELEAQVAGKPTPVVEKPDAKAAADKSEALKPDVKAETTKPEKPDAKASAKR